MAFALLAGGLGGPSLIQLLRRAIGAKGVRKMPVSPIGGARGPEFGSVKPQTAKARPEDATPPAEPKPLTGRSPSVETASGGRRAPSDQGRWQSQAAPSVDGRSDVASEAAQTPREQLRQDASKGIIGKMME